MLKPFARLFAAALLTAAGTAAAEGIAIDGAWVRAMPPTQKMTAGYFQLRNNTGAPIELVGASSPLAGAVEMHTTSLVDGVSRMRMLQTVDVAAGQILDFAPGGHHLMLFRVAQMPREGEVVTLCLQFAKQPEACFDADVQRTPPVTRH